MYFTSAFPDAMPAEEMSKLGLNGMADANVLITKEYATVAGGKLQAVNTQTGAPIEVIIAAENMTKINTVTKKGAYLVTFQTTKGTKVTVNFELTANDATVDIYDLDANMSELETYILKITNITTGEVKTNISIDPESLTKIETKAGVYKVTLLFDEIRSLSTPAGGIHVLEVAHSYT